MQFRLSIVSLNFLLNILNIFTIKKIQNHCLQKISHVFYNRENVAIFQIVFENLIEFINATRHQLCISSQCQDSKYSFHAMCAQFFFPLVQSNTGHITKGRNERQMKTILRTEKKRVKQFHHVDRRHGIRFSGFGNRICTLNTIDSNFQA